ncbi:putative hydrolase of the HAD superfamily [Glaciihabitans tibetensis]|uniref:Putative hydrolase of the HAD superfamily n=1 Tax=Glaciihabitans tibetensis TaxID=1266600 RepID=A0A2T0V5H2_9MICO|nr:HAD-IA family hydrolase [Glaciihabitans tibetensis]PRY65432.1 putative hydrolase of the HAD superfamily [Glaciihabitans tibetensis]
MPDTTAVHPGSAAPLDSATPVDSTAPLDSAKPLDVVWCDFGGVLTPHLDEAIGHVVEASGVPWPVLMAAAGEVARELGVTGLGPLELGLLSQQEWGARVAHALPPEQKSRVDLGRWDEYWYRDRPVNVELLEMLGELAATGVRIGMLTNSVAEWEPHRGRMLAGVTVFDAYVRSHEIGIAKPDPRIYAHADTVLAPSGGRVVLIDDLTANCEAAEANGWSSVHHVSTVDTVARLRAFAAR